MTFLVMLLISCALLALMHLILNVRLTRQSLTQDVCVFMACYCLIEILAELGGEYPAWAICFALFVNLAFWLCLMEVLVRHFDAVAARRKEEKLRAAAEARRADQLPSVPLKP